MEPNALELLNSNQINIQAYSTRRKRALTMQQDDFSASPQKEGTNDNFESSPSESPVRYRKSTVDMETSTPPADKIKRKVKAS